MIDVIKLLDHIEEIFKDMPFYLFSIRLFEEPIKKKVFKSLCPKRWVDYLYHFFESFDVLGVGI